MSKNIHEEFQKKIEEELRNTEVSKWLDWKIKNSKKREGYRKIACDIKEDCQRINPKKWKAVELDSGWLPTIGYKCLKCGHIDKYVEDIFKTECPNCSCKHCAKLKNRSGSKYAKFEIDLNQSLLDINSKFKSSVGETPPVVKCFCPHCGKEL